METEADVADTVEMASESESLESPPPALARPTTPPSGRPARPARPAALKQGRSVDERLIAYVRARRLLYDPAHAQYMDTELKNEQWNHIGRMLNADPAACKMRWNNVRDNYHRANRRRMFKGSHKYKYGRLLTFLDPYYKGRADPGTRRKANPKPESDESEDDGEAEKLIQEANTANNIKLDVSEENRSELADSIVEYDLFDKSASVSVAVNPTQSHAVDAFLAALAPPLKGLSPYHLSLAKAEIYATVHKYELKGIVEGGWPPNNVNPLQ